MRNLNWHPNKSRYSVITVRGYVDGDYIMSSFGSIKVQNPIAYKDARGWFELSNSGINTHYITKYIEDLTVIKRIKRPNIVKR